MTSITDKYSVNEADILSDQEVSIKLFRNNLNFNYDFDTKYDWLYKNNPYGKGHIFHLRDDENQTAAGVQCISGREFSNGKLTLNVGLFSDYAVDEKHRSLGPGLYLMKQVNQEGLKYYDLVYGFPNKKALPIYKRAGYDITSKMIRYSKPLNPRYIFKTEVPVYFLGILSFLTAPLLKIYDAILYFIYRKDNSFEIAENFTDEHAHLADEASINNNIVTCKRSREYLVWRYLKNNEHAFKIMNARNKHSGKLTGYIAYYISGDNTCYIIDVMTSDFDKYLLSLLTGFIRIIRKDRVLSVSFEFHGNAVAFSQLKRLLFFKRESRPIIYSSKHIDKNFCFSDVYLVAADEDAI